MWNLQSYPTTVLHERMVTCLAGSKHTLTPPVGTHNPQDLCPCILLEWNDNLLWCHICDVFSNLWTTCWVLNFIICFVSLVKRQNIIGHVVCTSVLGGSHVSGWERQVRVLAVSHGTQNIVLRLFRQFVCNADDIAVVFVCLFIWCLTALSAQAHCCGDPATTSRLEATVRKT